jgi:hypothetical protein
VHENKHEAPKLLGIIKLEVGLMIHKAKDLSPDQKMAIESLLGRSVADGEAISIRTLESASAPDWLQLSWESAKRFGLDQLSMEEIDAEIDKARKARRSRHSLEQ